ncbi:uncharacterized protein LOC123263653 [Cotesia glomerata]|uniref:C2 domain-containing protein n=1 Tax=Cotesia glomerata TaxID=32391 RepID=A0AAV7ING7_COTGL|nr:uncharacterized protein LOC123263653 [Cotesia glomerata]KAH0554697.1 hypothetical protein KQX54_012343 [Cotesia glomerata]
MSKHLDFILGFEEPTLDRRLSFKFSRARLSAPPTSSVLHLTSHPRNQSSPQKLSEDGLYVSPGPLTTEIVKPYQLDSHRKIITSRVPSPQSRVLEFSISEFKMADPGLITSVSLLHQDTVVCRLSPPFCSKLCKLLLKKEPNLSLKLTSSSSSVILPLPLPSRCVKNYPIAIDFSLPSPLISGQCVALMSLEAPTKPKSYHAPPTSDPNDPQNVAIRPARAKNASFFALVDPGLCIEAPSVEPTAKTVVEAATKVINEPATFSLRDITFNGWFEAARPLRPLKMADRKLEAQIMVEKNEVLALTVLRAVQVPVREENGRANPVLVLQWGDIVEVTKMADSANPIWQQTFNFGLPKNFQEEMGIKMILYDQHPTWGLQWLGESAIPTEGNENYFEIERWVTLSRLKKPILRFGYKENGDTRIYVCLKVKKNFGKEDRIKIDVLAKTMQRCVVPYKLEGLEGEVDEVVMRLRTLPRKVGPVLPRQALKIGKVDYFGRAALLASLLAGEDKDAFVVIGSSQVRHLAAYVVTVGKEVEVWDAENGEKGKIGDSGCSLVRIHRMVSHGGIWKNLQTSTLSNLRFNFKNSKDWQLITSTSATPREPQTLTLDAEPASENSEEMETYLKDNLSQLRSRLGFITIFNRHASSVLKPYLESLATQDPKVGHLEQLHRVYLISGYVVNLRYDGKEELLNFFLSTKIQEVTGPVEFSIVCNLQRHVGRIFSLWLCVAILRTRE